MVGPAALGYTSAGTKKPGVNLLFIMTDQQRFDAMSRAGNSILKTPNLDRLADEGVYFERAYSNCPICVPARAVILTGHSIESVRVTGNNDYDRADVADLPTFDNVLARHGYHSEYYGKWHTPYKFACTYENDIRQTGKHARGASILSQVAAYRQYLDRHTPGREARAGELIDNGSKRPYTPDPVDWRYGLSPDQLEHLRKRSVRTARAKDKKPDVFSQAGSYGCLHIPAEHSRTAYTAKEALAALEHVKDKPFSLTCSFGPPHPPMVLPRPYYGMYPPETLPRPASIDDPMNNSPYAERAQKEEMRRYRNEAYVRQMTSDYYGMVKEVDDWIGQILDKLRALDLERNTLVVFTSDHGEMLGDHGLHSKMVFYEGSARIPLLLRLPGAIRRGTVVRTPVSHVDLFATILDYLGMPEHPSDGRSLRSLIDGHAEPTRDCCVCEWGAKSGPTLMVRTMDWKYICSHNPNSPAVDALYHLRDDPHEMNNLIGKNPNKARSVRQAEAMKARLVAWLKQIDSPRLNGVVKRTL